MLEHYHDARCDAALSAAARLANRLDGLLRAEFGNALAERDGLLERREIDAIDRELALRDALFRANQRGIDARHHRFDRDLVVQFLVLLLYALALQPVGHALQIVILGNVMNARLPARAGPLRGQLGGHRFHARLIAAAVADQDDVLESVRAERRC